MTPNLLLRLVLILSISFTSGCTWYTRYKILNESKNSPAYVRFTYGEQAGYLTYGKSIELLGKGHCLVVLKNSGEKFYDVSRNSLPETLKNLPPPSKSKIILTDRSIYRILPDKTYWPLKELTTCK